MSQDGSFTLSSLDSRDRELGQQPTATTTESAPFSLAGPRVRTRPETRLEARPEKTQTRSHEATSFVSREYQEHDPRHGEPTNQPIWGLAAPLPRLKRPGMEPRHSRTARRRSQQSPQRTESLGRPPTQQSTQPSAPVGTEAAPQVEVTPDRHEGETKQDATSREGEPRGGPERQDLLRRATTAPGSTYHSEGYPTVQPEDAIEGRPSRQEQELAREHISAQDQATSQSSPSSQGRPSEAGGSSLQRLRSGSTTADVANQRTEDLVARPNMSWASESEVESARRRLQGLADTAADEPALSQHPPNIDWEEYHEAEKPDLPSQEEQAKELEYFNKWGKFRNKVRQPFAEFLGTMVFMIIGLCGSVVRTTASNDYGNLLTAYLAWGFAVMIGIYIAGGVSGGHLNPSVSIMLSVFRGFPWSLCWQYIVAQMLGAIVASAIVYGLYKDAIMDYSSSDVARVGPAFWTTPRDGLSATAAFFTEFTATAIASGSILALGDDRNSPPGAGMHAFIIGLLVSALCMAFSYNTGTALNPARDFGPRLITWAAGFGSEVFTLHNWWWIWGPWGGTITGALVGAFFYDALIFLGGESPVNYPFSHSLTDRIKTWKERRNVSKMGRGKEAQEKAMKAIENIA
ncbi:hypothetical protein LTR99_008487 [Exophiala xenobiotica]|uniref:Aquaporin-like protein n=1 Tax=Vermiconidia calcicola TaxID=1690605 RepID=A0AAV9Q0T6_9PEZI|nr:hypothetical protein LTR96_004546 [Exophiala xenobiotica]KAK5532877.1 hypothetical protein LTR25_007581 [Vermiconidia calcicola]KAK5546606.1 hypothetical protein LTR23_003353 [Chaetothyriales sp. CCFEE 6169]KAK5296846.1 hypothetical protein LTR99_008487 [Exophiala xenobiotica]KAK5340168.1 hypothetical protein LTR98_003289 [Exophiala xenobiotica]